MVEKSSNHLEHTWGEAKTVVGFEEVEIILGKALGGDQEPNRGKFMGP